MFSGTWLTSAAIFQRLRSSTSVVTGVVAVAAVLIAGVAAATSAASAQVAAAAGITFSGTPFGAADWDGDGHADVIARNDATAELLLYPGPGASVSMTTPPVVIGSGWDGFTPFGVADFDSDGHLDVIARQDRAWNNTLAGSLWMYPGAGGRGPLNQNARKPILSGWNGFTPFGVTDWDSDGHPDIIVRQDYAGNGTTASGLWMYRGNGVTVGARTLLLDGWNGFTPFGVADFNEDGHPDVIARQDFAWAGTPADSLWMYAGNGATAGARVQIGDGWKGFTPVGVTRWDGDSHLDVTTRQDFAWSGTPAGSLWMYPGTGAGLNQNARAAVAAAPAASVATSYFVSLLSDTTINASDDDLTTILSTDLTLRPGETRRLSDQISITLSSSEGAEVRNVIICEDPVTGAVYQSYSADTNHLGHDAGEVVLVESLLFTAPRAGTFPCQIKSLVSDGARTDFHGTAAKSGRPFTANGTWLKISSADEVGSHVWDSDSCNSTGDDPGCVYLGGPGDQLAFHMFVDGVQRDIWTAPNDTSTVDVVGNIRVTSCPKGSRSCRPDQWGDGGIFGIGKTKYAQFTSYLTFNQLYPDGSLCRLHFADGGGVTYLENSVHHEALSYHATVPVSPNCGGSRNFAPEGVILWQDGNPIKIDDGAVNVINQARTTTTTVPNVLGRTEAEAKGAIQSAGLTANIVGHVVNAAPAGTVFAQNAPGSTVEPTGSPVDLTVSLGAATVPEVVGDSQAGAKNKILAAGLTLGTVTFTNTCVDPGTVSSQNPADGTTVTPGSAVSIQVTTCTGGGTPK